MRASTFLIALLSLAASPASAQSEPLRRALNGESAGVRASKAAPSPGITVRCTSEIASSNEPLYVIDGVVVGPPALRSRLTDPADVLDVAVLRRPEAELRYGAAARNGVIEITTRSAPGRPAPAAAFPNPATGGAEVTLGVDLSGPVRVEVFDVLGRPALAFDAGADALTVPTAGLAAGAYVVRVSGAGGAEVRRVTVR